MPRNKGKKGLKKKQKQQHKSPKKNSKQQPKIEETPKETKSIQSSSKYMSKKALLEKYDVRLGPKGYVPAPNRSKSIHIEEFSMLDPGGGRELLTKTSIDIKENSIYGLVGKNGFGKTTLLKLMYNYEIELYPAHIRMVLVNQEELIVNDTILQSVLKADEIRERLGYEEDRLTRILGNLEDNDDANSEYSGCTEEEKNGIMDEINSLLELIWGMHEDLNYDQSEKRAMQILVGLGFTNKMLKTKKVNDLSGGWQMRVKLARALFVEPDLMLLDEPTNHLDFPTVLWLQNYLKKYEKTVIVVSHDRTFLNEVCNWTIHLTQKQLLYYRGNYDTMLKTAQQALVEQIKKYDALMKEVQKIKDWIAKYGQKGENMQQAVRSKRKTLENLESEAELLEPATMDRALKFEFIDPGELQEDICRMEEVDFKYENMEEMLLSNLNIHIDTDSRIGMMGANGVGKSTIVKLIMGTIKPLRGELVVNRGARIALFTQYHMDQLNLEQSAVEFLCERFAKDNDLMRANDKYGFIRRRLGRFKLTGKQHTQKMKYLSGGQKSRVAFCVATWTKPHFLIMDEPTNHLDMETIDSLVNAIEKFEGGVLLISHDQHFLSKAADEYWAVTPEQIKPFRAFETAKQFSLKTRLEQLAALGEEENDVDDNKEKYMKKKAEKNDAKNQKKLEQTAKMAKRAQKNAKKRKK